MKKEDHYVKNNPTTIRRRLGSGFLALCLIAALLSVCAVPVFADGVTVALHYNRPDGAYEDWDVWAWADGQDGNGYAFQEVDGEMVATIPVNAGVTRLGFIVRKGGSGWAGKDVDMDQFIDLPDVLRGTVHIYVESGVEGYTRVDGDDVVTGVLVASAKYDYDTGVIVVTTTGPVKGELAEVFTVQGPAGQVAVTGAAESAANTYSLTVEELDLNQSYKLIYDGTEYKINMPNIYSTDSFEAEYTYAGGDLGATWSAEKTAFRVWAPTAESVSVKLYKSGTEGTDDLIETVPMALDVNGTWVAEKAGDLNGTYYTYEVTVGGQTAEACDPYARTTGVNGKRAMVIDLSSTDPAGWAEDKNPNAGLGVNDAVIYELHVRDLSTDPSSGIQNVGKFLGLTETGTKTPGGMATGIDHIKELGATHVHLLPVYDYGSVDETKLDEPQFNWGYDPVNYNVPEGSYSTDPYNGAVRVSEMKQMVKAMHDEGLSVIMDVVYNHVQSATDFCFNKLVPGYFSRINENGSYSNGSGCGNDTASERSMVRKYIVESVKYWCDEYHIDGFRFDLVGLLDIETINELVEAVHAERPDVIFYGEGWTMSTSVTKEGVELATQPNSRKTPGFAYFSDNIRDALKGSVFDKGIGFVSGDTNKGATVAQSFMGKAIWCASPTQTVNYASCHDNNTLIDRITLSRPNASREDLIRMNNLAAAIYLTSQGIPFMQAGEEMLRTKVNPDGTYNENSYNASDEVNAIKWSTLDEAEYANVFAYYKGLIAFRKAHPALRQSDADQVRATVTQLNGLPKGVIGFEIAGGANGDTAQGLYVIFNATEESQTVALPEGYMWDVCVNGEKAGTEVLETLSGEAGVAPLSALIMVRGDAADPSGDTTADTTADTTGKPSSGQDGASAGVIAAVTGGAALVIAGAAVGISAAKRKKNDKNGKK